MLCVLPLEDLAGEVWRLPGVVMGERCRLQHAQPQPPDDPGDQKELVEPRVGVHGLVSLGLTDVEHHRGPRAPASLAGDFASVRVARLGNRNPGSDPDAVLAALDVALESSPRLERQDILSRGDLILGNALLYEARNEGRVVTPGLTALCPGQCFRPHL